jgi:hypothetical protein
MNLNVQDLHFAQLQRPINFYVCITPSIRSSPHCEDLDINRHPMSTCDLHHAIDLKFAGSSFMKNVSHFYFCVVVVLILHKSYDENGETSYRSGFSFSLSAIPPELISVFYGSQPYVARHGKRNENLFTF